jgi:hypothetical protein
MCSSVDSVLYIIQELLFIEGNVPDEALSCGFATKLKILDELIELLHNSYRHWKSKNKTELGAKWCSMDSSLDDFHKGIRGSAQVQQLQRMLVQAIAGCSCQDRDSIQYPNGEPCHKLDDNMAESDVLEDSDESDVLEDTDESDSLEDTDGSDALKDWNESDVLEDSDSDSLKSSIEMMGIEKISGSVLAGKVAKDRPDFDSNFDCYDNAPTLTRTETVSRSLRRLNLPKHLADYGVWRDMGFRLSKDFALNFNEKISRDTRKCYLPICEMSATKEIERSLGLCVVGMKEMLRMGGDLQDVFVRGEIDDSESGFSSLCLDIERDALKLADEEIKITFDIDSMIWTTFDLYLESSIKVFTTPRWTTNKAPIDAHNHTGITVLQPGRPGQAPKDRERKYIKHRDLPHIPFGQFNVGLGSVNIYVCFTRMIHSHRPGNAKKDSEYYATVVPMRIQKIWYEEVVQVAFRDLNVSPPDIQPYVNLTAEQWTRKANTPMGIKPQSLAVPPVRLKKLIAKMRSLTEQELKSHLKMFGSFFFITDVRGCKLLTKDSDSTHLDIYEAFKKEFSLFDVDRMLSDPYSECLIDLAMSAHPITKVPAVGIWRLSKLESSFNKVKTQKPNMRPLGTLSNYGCVFAEPLKKVAAVTHLKYRHCYNLIYQIVRGDMKFFKYNDAYRNNTTFDENILDYATRYEIAKNQKISYGVRDEWRMSLHALKEILPVAMDKV